MPDPRTEHVEVADGVRYRTVTQPRVRYPPQPVRRTRAAAGSLDPDALFARLDVDHAEMAARVLREGVRGWRRWSTIRRHAGPQLAPIVVETELLDRLCREAGLIVEDGWRAGRWVPQRFTIDPSIRSWLGVVDAAAIRSSLADEIAEPALAEALESGPPRGVDWRSFAFVLRAAQLLTQLDEHGVRPGARELAGLVDHTKAWTPRRRALVERLLGRPFAALVAPADRQIDVRGPVAHAEGGLWASAVGSVEIDVRPEARAVVLVENKETFHTLLPLADDGWVVMRVPGGPPPAECELLGRIVALRPDLPVHAAFDLDPAGVRIALTVEARVGVTLRSTAMGAELLEAAPRRRRLTSWDRAEIKRLAALPGSFAALVDAMNLFGEKAEQETLQMSLLDVLRASPKSS